MTERISKREKRDLSGVLLLDKSLGMSSNAALQKAKRLYSALKAGHTGSLDPLASGMLPICFGEATKFCQYLLDAQKEYYVVGSLGSKTTTGDSEGEICEHRAIPHFTRDALESVLQGFLGTISQVPPMYSALKHQGQALYRLARKGISIDRPGRTVQIYNIELLDFSVDTLTLKVLCSKGTYIRTLIEDIAERLGTCAHVSTLHRLSIAHFTSAQMITLDILYQKFDQEGLDAIDALLLRADCLLPDLPSLALDAQMIQRLQQGQRIFHEGCPEGVIRLYLDADFMGLGRVKDNIIHPERLLRHQTS